MFGGAVCGDHHRGRVDVADLRARPDAACAEVREDGFVVDQVTKDGEGLTLRCRASPGDGPTDTETHAHVTRFQDFHDAVSHGQA
jgi:hypothetical protein